MDTTTRVAVAAQVDRDVLAELAEIPEGWATAPQIAWEIAGAESDADERRAIYDVLKALAAAQVWECIKARNNGLVTYVYRADSAALTKFLAGEQ